MAKIEQKVKANPLPLYLRREETLSIISKHTTNSKLNFYLKIDTKPQMK